jgi:integrase
MGSSYDGSARQTRFHDLRHTCATLLLTKGVHPKIVSEMLGHSSVSITLDIYSHLVLPVRGGRRLLLHLLSPKLRGPELLHGGRVDRGEQRPR